MLPGNIQGLLYVIYVVMGILTLYGIVFVIRLRCSQTEAQTLFQQPLLTKNNDYQEVV